jgi:molybdopterin biosynthesis enzyme MoaB
METARQYGQQRMPFAMLSRGVAGMIGDALVITLPGSTKGAMETLDAIFPNILHVFKVNKGQRHD